MRSEESSEYAGEQDELDCVLEKDSNEVKTGAEAK